MTFAILAILLHATTLAAADTDSGPTMDILGAGINSRGMALWDAASSLHDSSTIASARRFRIELRSSGHKVSGPIQSFLDPGEDASDVETVLVNGPNDPRLFKLIPKLVAERHVVVNIDMDLVGLGKDSWKDQTSDLAQIATRIAQERKRAMPDSHNSILTHSAGSVGLSKIINSGHGDLFQTKVAAAPQTFDLSEEVLIVTAKGDFTATPTGAIGDISQSDAASQNVDHWLAKGNTVIRMKNPKLNFDPSDITSLLAKTIITGTVGVPAHIHTGNLARFDRDIEVLVPVEIRSPGAPPSPMRVETISLANVSPTGVIKAYESQRTRVGNGGGPTQSLDALNSLKASLKTLQPPKGGGIALRAATNVQVAASRVLYARWSKDENRILLQMEDGPVKALPKMDPALAMTAYQSVFGQHPADPELSIGASLVDSSRNVVAAGYEPVYTLGPIDGTLLALALLRADRALGDIAYGDSRSLHKRRLDVLEGYHSLPEMFPAKYVDQPLNARYLGQQERIVIQALPATLTETTDGTIAYLPVPELAVRFGRTSPAERAYADLFAAFYFELIGRIPELRDLVECSRAVGIFKWLKGNRVRVLFDEHEARDAEAFTPHQVKHRERVTIGDLAPHPPLILYATAGPVEIIDKTLAATKIEYVEGRLSAVAAPNGRMLRVYCDDLGNPLAVDIQGVGAGAFLYDVNGYIQFIDDVALKVDQGRLHGYEGKAQSQIQPVSEPWDLINMIGKRFIQSISRD